MVVGGCGELVAIRSVYMCVCVDSAVLGPAVFTLCTFFDGWWGWLPLHLT